MHARRAFLRLIGLAALSAGGCAPGVRPFGSGPLRIAFVPQIDMEERYAGAYSALSDYLRPRLERPIETFSLENANAAMEAMRAGRIDLCNFSPWPFLLAEQRVGLEALLVIRGPDGAPASYRGILVTAAASGIRSSDDLRRRSKDLVFAFEEVVSTSGHFAPRVHLHQLGISPERDFRQVIYGADGITNLLATRAGQVDVAALSDSSLQRARERRRIAPGEIEVIWQSPPLVSSVLAVRSALPTALKTHLARLLIELPEEDPARWAEVSRQYSVPVSGYLPVDSATLDYYRRAIRDTPGLGLNS
jgi:phosphonate transport system substrate-binding protein